MDIQAIAQSLLGSVNNAPTYGAPVNATATNTAELANIQNLGALRAQGDAASRATSALGTSAGAQADNEEAARRVAAAQAEAELKKKKKEIDRLNDPNEFKAIINDKGGYDFFDPMGNRISAVQYAKKKNVQISEVFKDSQDQNDIDFLDDYKRVMELGKIVQTGDAKARDKFYEKNPDFKQAYEKSTYEEIVKDLRNEYPSYFRSGQMTTGMPNKALTDVGNENDQRNFLKRATDQVIPSFLGNRSTYNALRS